MLLEARRFVIQINESSERRKKMTTATHSNISDQVDQLDPLVSQLICAESDTQRIELLDQCPPVQRFFQTPSPIRTFLAGTNEDCSLILKSLIAIGQDATVLRIPQEMDDPYDQLRDLIQVLLPVQKFYEELGGIVGYHFTVLSLLQKRTSVGQPVACSAYLRPPVFDLRSDSQIRETAISQGIQHLQHVAAIFPVGGAGDRLSLTKESTGEPLPAAKLEFQGRSLLEHLVRDLQAMEYLAFQKTGKQVTIPIALMTSQEKNNHRYILDLCEEAEYFGRPKESFRFFQQPLVPVITERGDWSLHEPLKLFLKPGGHGPLWRLAQSSGVFSWFHKLGKTKALIRQINNPIAGTDWGLLAFLGLGFQGDYSFGFASCDRLVNAAEGMDVLVETPQEGGFFHSITNVEYTDFAQRGIHDVPAKEGSPYSVFPSNTNILLCDIGKIQEVLHEHPYPGLLLNMKTEVPVIGTTGKKSFVKGGRLESTMQNIADVIGSVGPKPWSEKDPIRLPTFVTYNDRRKTISVTKKSYREGEGILETPEGCFYDVLCNHRELLAKECGVILPEMVNEEEYLKKGPNSLFLYHPALGPLFSEIAKKIQGGKWHEGAELQLDIVQVELVNVELRGSLCVKAESPLGKRNEDGVIQYGPYGGSCILRNVKVSNRGRKIEQDRAYWKNEIKREEECSIFVETGGEFVAENVTLEGKLKIVVPKGIRIVAFQGENAAEFFKEEMN